MKIAMGELEAFDCNPEIHSTLQLYLRKLKGTETFDYSGNTKPRSILFFMIYGNSIHGLLLTIEADVYLNICKNSAPGSKVDEIHNKYVIGKIKIDYGEGATNVLITIDKNFK
jgi:hypothetical protein